VTVELRVQTPEANISTLYSRADGNIVVDSTNLDTGNLFPLNTSASTSSTTFKLDGLWPPDFALAPGEHQYTLIAEYQQTEGERSSQWNPVNRASKRIRRPSAHRGASSCHKVHILAVESGKAFVERGDTAPVVSGKGNEVRVGNLAVPDDADELGCLVTDLVGPKCMPILRTHGVEDRDCVDGGLPFAEEESQERALGDRARRQVGLGLLEPLDRGRVVDVVDDRQRDQHVAVNEKRAHASSSSERTSSAVTGRPTEICGMPRLLVAISG
jgi:hypothetical protein